jgi:hypothetical protein
MLISAQAIALTAADLYAHPEIVAAAKADLQEQLKTQTYQSGLPAGQKPPLNYREE